MINDELRWKIENAQRVKCFLASIATTFSCIIWMMLLTHNEISKTDTIVVTAIACIFIAATFVLIFCNLGKATFELEVKNDPTKG